MPLWYIQVLGVAPPAPQLWGGEQVKVPQAWGCEVGFRGRRSNKRFDMPYCYSLNSLVSYRVKAN